MVKHTETPTWLYEAATSIDIDGSFMNIPNFLEDHNLLEKFYKHYGYTPSQNWLNITVFDGFENSFGWHNEQGEGYREGFKDNSTVKVSINETIWIAGSQGMGGELLVLDDDFAIISIPFEENKVIRMQTDVMHMVSHYSCKSPRISLNTIFNKS